MAASDQPRDPREEVRAEIREFLSTRRARITPEQAGLSRPAATNDDVSPAFAARK